MSKELALLNALNNATMDFFEDVFPLVVGNEGLILKALALTTLGTLVEDFFDENRESVSASIKEFHQEISAAAEASIRESFGRAGL